VVGGWVGRAFLLSIMQKQSTFLYMGFKGLQNVSECVFFSSLCFLGYFMKLMWMPFFVLSDVLNMVELLEMRGILFLKEQH
jgi:hypothetical protein